MVFSIEMMLCVHSRSQGLIFVYISVHESSQSILLCTQEYKMHSCVISSKFFCVHKSTYWNVVNTRVHQQFCCVSCGGINNLIWIFSLHFDIRLMINSCRTTIHESDLGYIKLIRLYLAN